MASTSVMFMGILLMGTVRLPAVAGAISILPDFATRNVASIEVFGLNSRRGRNVEIQMSLSMHEHALVGVLASGEQPLTALRGHARRRSWHRLRLLSTGSTFKYDLGSEEHAGNQDSTISVLTLNEQGTVRHFYTVHPRLGPLSKRAVSTSTIRSGMFWT